MLILNVGEKRLRNPTKALSSWDALTRIPDTLTISKFLFERHSSKCSGQYFAVFYVVNISSVDVCPVTSYLWLLFPPETSDCLQ